MSCKELFSIHVHVEVLHEVCSSPIHDWKVYGSPARLDAAAAGSRPRLSGLSVLVSKGREQEGQPQCSGADEMRSVRFRAGPAPA